MKAVYKHWRRLTYARASAAQTASPQPQTTFPRKRKVKEEEQPPDMPAGTRVKLEELPNMQPDARVKLEELPNMPPDARVKLECESYLR